MIYNDSFTGNGAHGSYNHNMTDLKKSVGKEKLIREKTIKEETNLDEVAVQEYMQLNFKGAELKGKRITDKKEAIDYIKKNNIKYNRGGNAGGRRSGLFSGGMMMREYERSQVKFSSEDFNEPEIDDEFEQLQNKIEKSQIDSNIMISSDGL